MASDSLPHLLFYGPPGTGKTSAILAVAKELFGTEMLKSRLLELNASDDRGISVVREKIKKFAQIAVARNPDSLCPAFKIIVLDEADSLTSDAQAALRRVIEKYTKVTRFCLICNYVSKIVDPLISRCMKFRFKPIAMPSQLERLRYICTMEGVTCPDQALGKLYAVSDGDLRRSITLLQSAAQLYGAQLSLDSVLKVAAVVPDQVIVRVCEAITGTFQDIERVVKSLVYEAYQADSVLLQIFDNLLEHTEFSDLQKAKGAEILAECDSELIGGGDESLILQKALSQLQLALRTNP